MLFLVGNLCSAVSTSRLCQEEEREGGKFLESCWKEGRKEARRLILSQGERRRRGKIKKRFNIQGTFFIFQ